MDIPEVVVIVAAVTGAELLKFLLWDRKKNGGGAQGLTAEQVGAIAQIREIRESLRQNEGRLSQLLELSTRTEQRLEEITRRL